MRRSFPAAGTVSAGRNSNFECFSRRRRPTKNRLAILLSRTSCTILYAGPWPFDLCLLSPSEDTPHVRTLTTERKRRCMHRPNSQPNTAQFTSEAVICVRFLTWCAHLASQAWADNLQPLFDHEPPIRLECTWLQRQTLIYAAFVMIVTTPRAIRFRVCLAVAQASDHPLPPSSHPLFFILSIGDQCTERRLAPSLLVQPSTSQT